MAAPETKHWSGTGQLRGGKSGIAFFMALIRFFGPRVAYIFAIFPAAYFSFASPDVPATMDFHRRIFGKVPWWKRRWYIFKHFFSFGRAIIDRSAILAGGAKKFSFTFDGEQNIHDAVAAGKGVLLLTAHVGNWEAAGQLLSRVKCPINVTGFDKELPAIRAVLDSSTKQHFKLIPLTGAPTDAIQLVAAMRRGELVCMMGDRTYGSPAQNIPFLGGNAPFPIGGYVMAAIAGAPIVTVFSLREPGGHYHFFGFPPVPPHRPAHHERYAHLRKCAMQFAERLEAIVKRDPFQWYNFFPFWNEQAKTKTESLLSPLASSPSPRIMPSEIEQLIPHRAPMRWVEELLDCTETTATATARFTAEHFAVSNGVVIETALVECMAQTVAAALGQRMHASGKAGVANNGMLAAVSNFKIHSRPPLDQTLTIEVKEVKRLGPMLMISGKISCGTDVIATGDLSLYA